MYCEPPIDDSHLLEDYTMFEYYMNEIKEQAMQKLTSLELAALYEDKKEFMYLYNEEMINDRNKCLMD